MPILCRSKRLANTKWEHSLDQGQPSLNLHFTSKQSIMLISPQDLSSSRYLADLSHKIDSVIGNSSALKTTFEACYPANFTPKEKAIVWEVCEDMLDSYGKMRASDLIKALSAASRPNGSDGLALSQYVNVVHSFCRY
jgi:hypothetical protein